MIMSWWNFRILLLGLLPHQIFLFAKTGSRLSLLPLWYVFADITEGLSAYEVRYRLLPTYRCVTAQYLEAGITVRSGPGP